MKPLLSIILITFAICQSRGDDLITLTGTNSYSIATNEVVEVISTGGPTSSFFTLNGSPVNPKETGSAGGIISLLPMVITGPSNRIGVGNCILVTLRIRTKAEYLPGSGVGSVASSTSVVIPEDAGGPVQVALESSTDLINWNAANPGTYGTSTTRRFFRVRAIRN